METEPSSRLPSVQAIWQRLRRFRWLGKLPYRAQAKPGDDTVSGSNREISSSPSSQDSSSGEQLSPLDHAVKVAVTRAATRAAELAKHEAGSEYGRLCPPLLLGPQRYRDPDMWGPDYRLRGAPLGSENTPEQIEAMQKVPLTEDKQWLEASRALDGLAAQLGLTPPHD